MNEIKLTITQNSITKIEAEVYLNVIETLNEMKMEDIVDFVFEYEDVDVLLNRIGEDYCKEYFGWKAAQPQKESEE